MTKITKPPIRALGILLMFLLSLGIKAQTVNTAVLTWDVSNTKMKWKKFPAAVKVRHKHKLALWKV